MFTSIVVKENEPQLVRKIYDKSKEYKDVVDRLQAETDRRFIELKKRVEM